MKVDIPVNARSTVITIVILSPLSGGRKKLKRMRHIRNMHGITTLYM